jgi:hypothetical protein
MKGPPQLLVSQNLSALMGRSTKPEPAPPVPSNPMFALPKAPAPEPGEPTVSVHCFLTDASAPGFSHDVRSVTRLDSGADRVLRTKFVFRSVTTGRLPLLSRGLDRNLVSFMGGATAVFCSIADDRRDLSELSQFVLRTNAEAVVQRDFLVKLPDGSLSKLTESESFMRSFSQIVSKSPPFSSFTILNLCGFQEVRQFAELLQQIRSKSPLSTENSFFISLFPLFRRNTAITIFLCMSISDEFLLTSFAHKKKSVIERERIAAEFAVDFSIGFPETDDPTALIIERAADHIATFKQFVGGQLSEMRSGGLFRLLTQLDESERANEHKRKQIADIQAEIASMEAGLRGLRERQRLRDQVEREKIGVEQLRRSVQEVIARTEQLRVKYEGVVEAMRIETAAKLGEVKVEAVPTMKCEGPTAQLDKEQKKARERWRRQQAQAAENDASAPNNPAVEKKRPPIM